jgi:hypothetical protein
MTRRHFAQLLALGSGPGLARAEARALPSLRIAEDGWGSAGVNDLRAVFHSAASMLWPYFPERKLESIFVTRSHSGPIVHFERNYRKEIVMALDSEDTHWAQFAYQFSHEFCHVLAGFDQDGTSNLWFEETFCEASSLFCLLHMAEQWRTKPPFPNWKSYAGSLDAYVEITKKKWDRITTGRLPEFYQKHTSELRASPTRRELNGAMSLVILELLEQTPASWEAVSWLNSSPSAPDETFEYYLTKWLRAAPSRHQPFIAEVMRSFGIR